jgi:hypothetical protein
MMIQLLILIIKFLQQSFSTINGLSLGLFPNCAILVSDWMIKSASENSINLSMTSPAIRLMFGVVEVICAVIAGINRLRIESKNGFN